MDGARVHMHFPYCREGLRRTKRVNRHEPMARDWPPFVFKGRVSCGAEENLGDLIRVGGAGELGAHLTKACSRIVQPLLPSSALSLSGKGYL